jgi:hypothetical protein
LVARQIVLSRGEHGFVSAVTGPWGSGKTSVLHMVEAELREREPDHGKLSIFNFNPWLFSGSEQLTALFFLTLSEHLQRDLESRASRVAERLRSYGAALGTLKALPGIGGLFETAANVTLEGAERAHPAGADLVMQRKRIVEALVELDVHVVVLIDDVDRLPGAAEIRDLMRMVKLVGDLPGVTYVLSYDRRPVAAALSAEGIDGSEYLEKIVQVEHRLPEPSRDRLHDLLVGTINEVIGPLPNERLEGERFSRVFKAIIWPLVETPRHIRRFGNALRLSLDLHQDEVDLVDQLALTALAVVTPKFHNQLAELADALHPSLAFWSLGLDEARREEAASKLRDAAEESGRPEVASSVYRLLFPGTQKVLQGAAEVDGREAERRRRVADPEAFWRYMTGVLPDSAISMGQVVQIQRAAAEPASLPELLEERSNEDVGRLASRLRAHLRDFDPETLPALGRAFLMHMSLEMDDQWHRIDAPARNVEFFVEDLLELLPPDQRRDLCFQWFESSSDVRVKHRVFEVSRGETANHEKLLSELDRDRLLEGLAEQVCATEPEQLLTLPVVGRLLWLTTEHFRNRDKTPVQDLLSDDPLFARFLEVFSEEPLGGGPRQLQWTALQEAVDASWLAGRLEQVDAAALSVGARHLIKQARKRTATEPDS